MHFIELKNIDFFWFSWTVEPLEALIDLVTTEDTQRNNAKCVTVHFLFKLNHSNCMG